MDKASFTSARPRRETLVSVRMDCCGRNRSPNSPIGAIRPAAISPANSGRRTFLHCQGCTGSGTAWSAGMPQPATASAKAARSASGMHSPAKSARPSAARAAWRASSTTQNSRNGSARSGANASSASSPQPSRPLLATALGWPDSSACISSGGRASHASPSMPRQRARRDASAWRVRPTSRTKPAVAAPSPPSSARASSTHCWGSAALSSRPSASQAADGVRGLWRGCPRSSARRRSGRSRRRPGAASLSKPPSGRVSSSGRTASS